jgi:hypothetical protein
MTLSDWAIRHQIPHAALHELKVLFGTAPELSVSPYTGESPLSEAAVQAKVRLEASAKGMRLFRNNVGAGYLQDGSFLRWGLANDSDKANKAFKSADLIGIRPVTITKDMVGGIIGQFVSREVKAQNWKYKGDARELAQVRWAELIISMGGDASFCTDVGTL